MPKRVEKHLETDVCKFAKELGGYALKLQIASEGGWMDRTLFLPEGRIILPELKREDGKGSKRYMQGVWIERLQSLGFDAGFCDCIEDVHRLYLTKEKRGRT